MTEAIHTEGLVKTFGRNRALDGLDLNVRTGEVHGFLGPNGAGKSTTIRVLLGLLRADSGHASLLGGDPWRDAVELHRRLAYVPGDDHIGDCYLNGYGIQGMVIAARVIAGLEPLPPGADPDSEGDTCYMHFADLDSAVETATLAHAMIHDPERRAECARLAVEEGFDDM